LVKNILAPVDGSEYMERNVTYACEIAKSMDAKLTLLHVVTLPEMMLPEPPLSGPGFPVDVKPFEQAGLEMLETARNVAQQKGVHPETKLRTVFGNPAQAIIGAAETEKFDLVIIGAKGHSLLRNLTLGSVSDIVVHNAPCPVLVVR